jgi:3-phenylpropionate/cinnamic acid dioxygenase small subunit
MLYSEIIAVYSQIHTKHINTSVGRTYRAVKTLRLCYKDQSVNPVQWNYRCLFSDPHKTHKYTVGRTYRVVKKLRLCYKDHSVNAVQCNYRCFFLRSTQNT